MTVPPLDLHHALALCGLDTRKRRTGPCPACGVAKSGKDPRPPVIFGKRGWLCVACHAKGDGYTLVGYHLRLPPPLQGRAFRTVLAFVQGQPAPAVAQVEDEAPTRVDPLPALRRAMPLRDCVAPDVVAWLAERRISPTAPAGYLRGWTSAWWPDGYRWPIVVPACTGRGEVVSMHGRAVSADVPSKTRWPKGASAGGLLFAGPQVRAWLRTGEGCPPELVVVEGLTDYLTWSAEVPEAPCVGIASGSVDALRLWRVARASKVYVATDADDVGDHYAEGIADALADQVAVRRVPLARLKRVA